MKLYLSYIKHKSIYREETPLSFPDEIYVVIIKYLDTFDKDIDEFKNSIDKEVDIIPEVLIQTHIIFDTIDRMRVMDRIYSSNTLGIEKLTEVEKIAIKRAQFYSLEHVFNEFFSDILTDVRKYTTVKKYFVDNLNYFQTDKYFQEAETEQIIIMKKYFESLNRQGLSPNDFFKL